APKKIGSQTEIGPSLEDQPRLRQTSLLSACNSQRRKVCRAAVYARAGHVTARHFCDWLGRRARHSRGRLRMSQSQDASDVRGDGERRERGRPKGTQLSSSSHLDRSDGQTSRRSKGSLPSQKSSAAWTAAVIGGRNSRLALRSVHVPLRVFGCGEAEKGDPLGGANMQCGGGGGGQASRDERSRCEKVGREERRWRGTESEGGRGLFYRS
ncbi:hypothetical protein V496_02908, partial [Pseudogymnoascus sp. VKM F-4515 (FW-2607)]